MVNVLFGKHDISMVQRLSCGMPDFNDGFPKSRICVGAKETDSFEAAAPSSDTALNDRVEPALHMTLEHCDPIVGLRFARTYFLSALAADGDKYMKGINL